ncbi:elastin-like [Mustela putorius furo]|uniref:Elastin-like n=1 Tax=Mustela putorius furo TaxID=9669 RepID=A0A8U0SD20_MUSPF|nr:elastin-like [Mustela putorius furo]
MRVETNRQFGRGCTSVAGKRGRSCLPGVWEAPGAGPSPCWAGRGGAFRARGDRVRKRVEGLGGTGLPSAFGSETVRGRVGAGVRETPRLALPGPAFLVWFGLERRPAPPLPGRAGRAKARADTAGRPRGSVLRVLTGDAAVKRKPEKTPGGWLPSPGLRGPVRFGWAGGARSPPGRGLQLWDADSGSGCGTRTQAPAPGRGLRLRLRDADSGSGCGTRTPAPGRGLRLRLRDADSGSSCGTRTQSPAAGCGLRLRDAGSGSGTRTQAPAPGRGLWLRLRDAGSGSGCGTRTQAPAAGRGLRLRLRDAGRGLRLRLRDAGRELRLRLRDAGSGSGCGTRTQAPAAGRGLRLRLRDADSGSGSGMRDANSGSGSGMRAPALAAGRGLRLRLRDADRTLSQAEPSGGRSVPVPKRVAKTKRPHAPC